MGKRPIFVLLVILAGAFVTAEDAPPPGSEVPEGTNPALANATELELFVGTEDGKADNEYRPNIVDVSSGLPIFQAPNETQSGPVPLGAPMSAPTPSNAATGGHTKILVEKIKYKWTIMNYKHHGMEYGEPLYSPVFSGKDTEEYQWQLQFYPRGNDPLWKPYASLYLASVGRSGAKPEVNFYIIDHLGNNVNPKKFTDKKFAGEVYGFGAFVAHYTLEVAYHKIWVPDDRLTLVAEITFSPGMKNIGHCTDLGSTQCLAMPYDNKESSDLYLFLSTNENIRAQKATLMAHSTWITKQLQDDPRVNAIKLPANITSEQLRAALKFVYTGKVHPSMAQKLKEVADQLGMSKLKAMCDEVLCKAAINAASSSNPASAA